MEYDHARARADHDKLLVEHQAIAAASHAFNAEFSELELALGNLLYEALHVPDSRVAHAIYYTPPRI